MVFSWIPKYLKMVTQVGVLVEDVKARISAPEDTIAEIDEMTYTARALTLPFTQFHKEVDEMTAKILKDEAEGKLKLPLGGICLPKRQKHIVADRVATCIVRDSWRKEGIWDSAWDSRNPRTSYIDDHWHPNDYTLLFAEKLEFVTESGSIPPSTAQWTIQGKSRDGTFTYEASRPSRRFQYAVEQIMSVLVGPRTHQPIDEVDFPVPPPAVEGKWTGYRPTLEGKQIISKKIHSIPSSPARQMAESEARNIVRQNWKDRGIWDITWNDAPGKFWLHELGTDSARNRMLKPKVANEVQSQSIPDRANRSERSNENMKFWKTNDPTQRQPTWARIKDGVEGLHWRRTPDRLNAGPEEYMHPEEWKAREWRAQPTVDAEGTDSEEDYWDPPEQPNAGDVFYVSEEDTEEEEAGEEQTEQEEAAEGEAAEGEEQDDLTESVSSSFSIPPYVAPVSPVARPQTPQEVSDDGATPAQPDSSTTSPRETVHATDNNFAVDGVGGSLEIRDSHISDHEYDEETSVADTEEVEDQYIGYWTRLWASPAPLPASPVLKRARPTYLEDEDSPANDESEEFSAHRSKRQKRNARNILRYEQKVTPRHVFNALASYSSPSAPVNATTLIPRSVQGQDVQDAQAHSSPSLGTEADTPTPVMPLDQDVPMITIESRINRVEGHNPEELVTSNNEAQSMIGDNPEQQQDGMDGVEFTSETSDPTTAPAASTSEGLVSEVPVSEDEPSHDQQDPAATEEAVQEQPSSQPARSSARVRNLQARKQEVQASSTAQAPAPKASKAPKKKKAASQRPKKGQAAKVTKQSRKQKTKKAKEDVEAKEKAEEKQEGVEKREADERAAEQRAAEQREAEQREAEQREAEQREAEQREAEQREAEQREAEQREAEQREAEQREAEKQETEKKEAKKKSSSKASRHPAARPVTRAASKKASLDVLAAKPSKGVRSSRSKAQPAVEGTRKSA